MRICIATGTRAEYGLLKPLLEKIKEVKGWQLQLLVTGAHLSPEFGLTYKTIEKDGFIIDSKVEMLLSSDSPEGIVKSMGLGLIGYADSLKNLKPDLLIILGDRYEMLALASSALIFKIPIVHLHGGEITEGAYDDAIRHSITKMSFLHFTSTEDYRKRIIQLGENPKFVYNVGAIGLENIKNQKLLSREELEQDLGIRFKKYNYQVTFHPATLDDCSSEDQFKILLNAIEKQKNSYFIFTYANSDTNGRIINQMINKYVGENPDKSAVFISLGNLRFLSVVRLCDAIVGNSSSGIIEAPSLHTPTINIGERQKGRIQAESILNTCVDIKDILNAFKKIKTLEFKDKVKQVQNPYYKEDTSQHIINILKNIDFTKFKSKLFYNIPYEIFQ